MIYEIKRDNVVIFTHEIRGSRTQSAPAVDFLDIEFDYYEAILLKRNDTIEFDGQIYYCDKQYANYQKKSNNLYNHRARFVSENYRATEIAVLDPQDVSKFEVEGNLLTLLTLAVDNLNRVSSGWSYATPVPNTVTKLFVIEEENVMSFLTKVSGEFEIPFYIKNKVVTFAYPNITDEGDFSYGKGNGFLDINKSYKSGEKVPNTIYVTGGDDLVLDNPVVHTGDINVNGVIEGFYNNDNIKPTTRTQVVGSTSTENVATTNLINYDLNLYKIAGQSPIINFETGALAGLSFFVTKFDYNVVNNVSLIYFKKRFVDGTEYPNSSVKPNNGDFFNITNITQPQAVIDEAKITLKTRAESYLNDLILKNLVLKVNLDRLFNEDLELNNRIRIVDNNLDIDDYFIVNEIKTDLQNLNKKELQLGHIGTATFAFVLPTLPTKNDNIIELGIDRNYDDLVVIEEEMTLVKADTETIKVDLRAVEISTSDLESLFENIETVELPSKEKLSNKKTTLDFEEVDSEWYPNITAVKVGLDNTLTQANNYTNNAVNNAVGGSGVVNSVTGVNVDNSDPKNPIVAEFRPIAQYNSDISNIQSQLNTKLESADLDGFIYDVTYNSTTHTITFHQQNEPNIVIDLPIEQLIKGVQLVGNDLVFTFEDGSTVTVPLNTLLVGVVKSVNGLTPNSQGEIVLNISDIPGLTSELNQIGALSTLTTTNKNDLVEAVNEVNGKTFLTPYHRRYTVITPSFNTTGVARIKIARQFAGMIKIHLTGGFSYSNVNGYIEVSGGFGINANGSFWNNQLRCTTSIGQTRGTFYIDPVLKKDPVDDMVYFDVHKKWADNNYFTVEIELLSIIPFHASTNPVYDSFDSSATVTTLANEVTIYGLAGSGGDKIVTVGDDGTLKRTTSSISDFQNNYLDTILTTNGTTAGTVYTFKRVGLSDLSITLTPASTSFSGVVTTGTQTFEGVKTFNQQINTANHGDSSQWKLAYDWGNHALAGYALAGSLGNYVSKTLTEDIGGTKKFTGSYSQWVLNDDAVANSRGFIQSLPGYFALGTLNDKNVILHRNSVIKVILTDSHVQFIDNIVIPNGTSQNHAVALNQLGNYAQLSQVYTQAQALGLFVGKTGVETIQDTKTFTHSPIVPNGTLNGHAVNLGQLNTILNAYALASAIPTNNNQLTNGAGYITASALGGYVQQSSLNTQLANYVTLGSVQTITATKTFTVSPIVPNGTLSGHTVNLGQMQAYVASQIPGNSGIESIRTDNSAFSGPAYLPDLFFNFHEYWGFPQAFAEETQPGNATAKATQGQLDFFASYDSVQTVVESSGTVDVDMKGRHIVNVLLMSNGGDVYLPDGVYAGDQVNITTKSGYQINIYANNLIATVGNEVFSFANLIWDCDLEGWVLVAYGTP